MSFVTCPECGGLAEEIKTRFGVRHQHCGLWSWNRKPLVCAATHEARKEAHRIFDEVWRSGRMSRSEAYRSLSDALNIPREHCHIAEFDADQCKRVIEYANGWLWTARAALGEGKE